MFVFSLFLLSYLVVGVYSQPTVTVSPVTFNVGEDATMMCTYTLEPGDVFAGLSWYKADENGNSGSQLVSTGITVNGRYSLSSNNRDLIITNVEVNDAGNYLCRITLDTFNNAEDVGMLSVNYINGNLMIDVNNSITAQNVIITCSGTVDGEPIPDINLYRDNTVIITQTTLPLTHTIATVSENDEGNYRCESSNTGTVTSNTTVLHYYLTGTVTISSTSNDTTIVLNCSGSVDGNPSPDITLHKDGDIILQQSTLPLIYTISSPTENDAGHYMCEADSTAFSTRSSVLELYKPRYEIIYVDTIKPGEEGTITLENVEATPESVTFVWSIDGDVDQDAISAMFTFTASKEVGTVHEIIVNVTNLIGLHSETVQITVSDEDEHILSTGAIVGIVVGAAILVMVLIYLKFRAEKPSTSRKQSNEPAIKEGAAKPSLRCDEKASKTGKSSSFKVTPAKAEISTDSCLQVEYTHATGEIVQHCDWYKWDKKGGNKNFLVRSGDANSRLTVADDGSLNIPKVKEDDDGYYCCEMKTSLKVVSFHVKLTVTNASKNAKSSSKKNKSNVEPAIEMEEGKAPLSRYEAKGGDLYTVVNLKDKKKKQVEPEKDPSKRCPKVDVDKKTKKPDHPPQDNEGLTHADLDLTPNVPAGGTNEIIYPDPTTTYASINPLESDNQRHPLHILIITDKDN